MGMWHFIVQHVWGDKDTMPDHARLAWILALITINMDLSVPVLYSAIMTTSYGCDVFTLYGIYYGLSQANFVMPIVCGWLVDFLGTWSHIVLIITCVLLSIMQAATLITSSVWLLGAIFLARQWLINQAVVQSYKLMAIRTHKVYDDDEDKKEQECQRTGATADFWTSLGEAIAYAIVYFMPSQIGRYVLVSIATGSTIVVAIITLSYSRADLLKDDGKEEKAAKQRRRSSMVAGRVSAEGAALLDATDEPTCGERVSFWFSFKEDSPLVRFGRYLAGIKVFFTVFMVAVPFFHYILLQLFRAMVTLPLNQNEAAGLNSPIEGVCDGVLKNIYLQGFFSQVFYIIGAVLYLRFVALIKPTSYFLFIYPMLAVVFGGLASVFYFDNVSVYVGATVLAVMNTASYYGTEFDTWYLMSVIDDDMYGYYTVVSGVLLSLTGLGASAFMTFQISNQMLLLVSQGIALLTVLMSIVFAIVGRKKLKEVDLHGGDSFAPLDVDDSGADGADKRKPSTDGDAAVPMPGDKDGGGRVPSPTAPPATAGTRL